MRFETSNIFNKIARQAFHLLGIAVFTRDNLVPLHLALGAERGHVLDGGVDGRGCHDTSLKRGTDVAFTFRGVAFRILLVTIFSCVGPRPFCTGYKPCPCGEEPTNK